MPADTGLAEKSCTPCRGGVPRFTPDEAGRALTAIPQWTLRDDSRRIERAFKFKDFAVAFAFIQGVANVAENEGHHPDIHFGWGYATISLQTHKIDGLHDNDFIMAAKLDRIAAELADPNADA